MTQFTIDTTRIHSEIPNFQLLRGRDNYLQWCRDVKIFASGYDGVWELLTAAPEKSAFPTQPNFKQYFKPDRRPDETEVQLSPSEMQFRRLHYENGMKIYFMEFDRLNAIISMLTRLVEPSIRNTGLTSPRVIW